jgi:cytochrome c biogenesis protein CcmG, thiol:disulfide interchange protein DsbE
MSASRRFWPWMVLALAAAVFMAVLPTPEGPVTPTRLQVGQPAPDFRLPRLDDGQRQVGTAELRGRVWLLNAWASWCAPCADEHPLLVALARETEVPLVGLNHRDDPRAAEEWLRRHGDPYAATALDSDGRVGLALGIAGVPATLVIDGAGIVQYHHAGPITRELWQRELLPLIRRLQG